MGIHKIDDVSGPCRFLGYAVVEDMFGVCGWKMMIRVRASSRGWVSCAAPKKVVMNIARACPVGLNEVTVLLFFVLLFSFLFFFRVCAVKYIDLDAEHSSPGSGRGKG